MNDSTKASRDAWRRQAASLRSQFESVAAQHLRESSGCATVEFALVQHYHGQIVCTMADYDSVGDGTFPFLKPLDRKTCNLDKRNQILAVAELQKQSPDIPCDKQWACQSGRRTGWARTFATNLPPDSQGDSPPSEPHKRLSQTRRIVTQLFKQGEMLLRTAPFSSPDFIRFSAKDYDEVDQPRDIKGMRWLTVLFEGSWGPAHPFGLQTVRQSAIGATMNLNFPYSEGKSRPCFYCISRDVLMDSARLIDWLLSLCDADVPAEAKVEPPKPVEVQAGGVDAGGGKVDVIQTTKGKRGRRKGSTASDPKEDQRIANAWNKGHGQYTRHKQLAQEFGIDTSEVKAALDRHRTR